MKRLYVGSGVATRSTWSGSHNTIDIEHVGFQYVGTSLDEANGWAMRQLRERLSSQSGYGNYYVSMVEMPASQIQEWLDEVTGDGEVSK